MEKCRNCEKVDDGITGAYTFTIEKEDDWYIARGTKAGDTNSHFITQGKTEQEIFEMIADALMCYMDVPVKMSWWKKLYNLRFKI